MTADTPLCPRCHLPTKSDSSGRMTQWLSVCMCGLQKPNSDQTQTVDMCTLCGKRVREGRKGTFTQYIFRSDLCSCDVPRFVQSTSHESAPAQTALSREEENEDELSVDADKFPLERYKPIKLLGKGAAGTVYQCRDRLLQKRVILKTLHVARSNFLIAFHNEAKVLSILAHPNIVSILDFGATSSGTPYMVLDYNEGMTLEETLRTHGPLPWSTAIAVFTSLAAALQYCHNHSVFHRDVKPSNILMVENGEESTVKLFDFGVAENQAADDDAQQATIVGTPSYMSPDQACGKEYDSRSEVYALGCVLFESLTGTPPFTGDTPLEILRQHAIAPIPALKSFMTDDYPEKLESVIAGCLAKDPEDRFPSVGEVGKALQAAFMEAELREEPATTVVSDSTPHTDGTVASFHKLPASVKIIGVTAAVAAISISTALLMHLAGDNKSKHAVTGALPDERLSADAEIDNIKQSGDMLTAESAYNDAQMKRLIKRHGNDVKRLFLQHSAVTGKSFGILAKLPKLVELNISDTTVGDQGMQGVGKIKNLYKLNANATNISDSGLEPLTALQNLREVELDDTAITDEGVMTLSKIKTLQSVSLNNCIHLTNASLKLLTTLPNLTKLYLIDVPKIKDKEIAEFKTKKPDCKIQFESSFKDNFNFNLAQVAAGNSKTEEILKGSNTMLTTPAARSLYARYKNDMKDPKFAEYFRTWKGGPPPPTDDARIKAALKDKELRVYLELPQARKYWADPDQWRLIEGLDQQVIEVLPAAGADLDY